jgi:hypothetical protein
MAAEKGPLGAEPSRSRRCELAEGITFSFDGDLRRNPTVNIFGSFLGGYIRLEQLSSS